MNNPFDTISARLSNIESLLLDLKHKPVSPQHATYDLLSVEEAAAYINVKASEIHSMVQRQELTACKRGKHIYLSKQELDDRLKLNRQAS